MEKMMKEKFRRWKDQGSLLVLVVDEGDGNPYTSKGKILDFDEEYVELQTYSNTIILKISNICKIKSKENGDG